MRVRLPALRERSDRAELCQRLLLEENHGEAVALSPALCQWLDAHPGRAICASCAACCARRWPAANTRTTRWTCATWTKTPQPTAPAPGPSPDGRLADIEQRAILHTLSACAGNMSAAARQLGISRATLYRRLRGAAA